MTEISGARWVPDFIGVLIVFVAAFAVVLPALAHGTPLGPFDILDKQGLAQRPGVVVQNSLLGDQIGLFIPWTNLAWTQVHQGHLPLWNPYSALGTPLAFNWESATFSLPSLVGYAFPMAWAYTVQMIASLLIAGSGAYVLSRTLRIGVLGSVMAGISFELSGAFLGFLGWSSSSTMAWSGWIFAFSVLIVQKRHRTRSAVLLAVALAFAIYAGYPEAFAMLVLSLLVFLIVILWRARISNQDTLESVGYLAGASLLGLCLAAPLLLPGIQLSRGSNRLAVGPLGKYLNFPFRDLTHLVFPAFDGLPVHGSIWFGNGIYSASATYIGVIALVLSVIALVTRWRNETTLATAAVALLMVAILLFSSLWGRLPILGQLQWYVALFPLAFALAVLAGIGLDSLTRLETRRSASRIGLVCFGIAGAALLAIWVFERGRIPSIEWTIRSSSFIAPAIEVVVGIVALLALFRIRNGSRADPNRHMTLALAAVLVGCQAALLVSAGAPLFSTNSSASRAPTQAEKKLVQIVGPGRVGFGQSLCGVGLPVSLGITPNANLLYGLNELAVYDPVLPRAYFVQWEKQTGQQAGFPVFDIYCPAVASDVQARLYGVEYVLEPAGHSGPAGSSFDIRIGNEDLFRIPGTNQATLVPQRGSAIPSIDSPGSPAPLETVGPTTWRVHTDSSKQSLLRVRLTDVPGWSATIDGHPLRLNPFAGVMLQAQVPPGRHTVELHYWPRTFSVGLALAAAALLVLVVVCIVSIARRTRNGRELHARSTGSQ